MQPHQRRRGVLTDNAATCCRRDGAAFIGARLQKARDIHLRRAEPTRAPQEGRTAGAAARRQQSNPRWRAAKRRGSKQRSQADAGGGGGATEAAKR